MFTRLRNTAYILSHREEKALPHFTPEVEFIEHTPPQYSKISELLASGVAFIAFIFIIRIGIAPAVHWLEKATGHPEASLTAVGLVGALMWFVTEKVINAVRDAVQKRFGIALTPHLGHRLEETYRILRG